MCSSDLLLLLLLLSCLRRSSSSCPASSSLLLLLLLLLLDRLLVLLAGSGSAVAAVLRAALAGLMLRLRLRSLRFLEAFSAAGCFFAALLLFPACCPACCWLAFSCRSLSPHCSRSGGVAGLGLLWLASGLSSITSDHVSSGIGVTSRCFFLWAPLPTARFFSCSASAVLLVFLQIGRAHV